MPFRLASSLPIDPSMIVTTSELPGHRIVRTLGVAEGISTATHGGILANGKKRILLENLREAYLEMLNEAARHGATAIIGLQYGTHYSRNGLSVLAYGTAVEVVPIS